MQSVQRGDRNSDYDDRGHDIRNREIAPETQSGDCAGARRRARQTPRLAEGLAICEGDDDLDDKNDEDEGEGGSYDDAAGF